MTLDMMLVNAFLALTPLPNAKTKKIIIDALNADKMDIHIPGMPLKTVSLTVDYAVFMFCYSWETGNSFAPQFTRQPRLENYDQSSPDYGNRSFALAAQYGIDVMVGYWAKGTNVFENFRRSISKYAAATPKVAYSMEFKDAKDSEVTAHLDLLWKEEFNLPRYCRIFDRANQWRFPVIFWGNDEVGPATTPDGKVALLPDPVLVQRLGVLLRNLKSRRASDGAQAYVIWHSQMLDRFVGLPENLKSTFKAEVIDQIDAFYQHEISIPRPIPAKTWKLIDPNHWETFPYTEFKSAVEVTGIQQEEIRARNLIASDGSPIIVIPGTMPQFSRERYAYNEHVRSQTLSEDITQSRVNLTDIGQLSKTLDSMVDLAETYRLKQQDLSWTVRRMIALSTWNEYREGTTWEPCAPDTNEAGVFGMTDTTGEFLTEARKKFDTATLRYRIGDSNYHGDPGDPGHPGHPDHPRGPGGPGQQV